MQEIIFKNITKYYSGRQVLQDINFKINAGEIIGLLGPNGAGKTTLLKIAAGLSVPARGAVIIKSSAGGYYSPRGYCAKMAFVPQDNNLEKEFTVNEALLSYAKLFGIVKPHDRVKKLVDQLKMTNWCDRSVDKLSGGMARRAMIARALLPEPNLILLDEPSVGLDPDMRREIWHIIKDLRKVGKTIILTTHYMDEAEMLCDRIAFLKAGKLLAFTDPSALTREICQGQPTITTLEEAFLCLAAIKEDNNNNGLVGCI